LYKAKVAVHPSKTEGFLLAARKLKIDALMIGTGHIEAVESVGTIANAIMGPVILIISL